MKIFKVLRKLIFQKICQRKRLKVFKANIEGKTTFHRDGTWLRLWIQGIL